MRDYGRGGPSVFGIGLGIIAVCSVGIIVLAYIVYSQFRIDVPSMHIAVMTRKTGENITNEMEVAPDKDHKGLQLKVLTEGRYFYNCYSWDWEVHPMIEIPGDKMGIRTRLYGDDLPYGHFVALKETEKGIIKDVLKPGRYPINGIISGQAVPQVEGQPAPLPGGRKHSNFVEIIELHEPITIPAGFRGIVTNLAGEMPENPNQLLVPKGKRGVQKETLSEGTYYMNPYMWRIELIDCRSQRFNLAKDGDMGFPSKDGFWVSLDGVIEFRVIPDPPEDGSHGGAAEVFVTYNEDENGSAIDEEIIRKIIMPNARSFCRLRGANSSGRDFIGGKTRQEFQANFQEAMVTTCKAQGIEIVQALITRIKPPEAIAGPVRDREIAVQQKLQYDQETLQQVEEAKLATETALIEQKQELVDAEREVVRMKTEAQKLQDIALSEANRDKEVADLELQAAKDKAIAILAEKTAEAAVIGFENEADAAGWKKAIESLGDGQSFATYVMYQKLAPSYRQIMANTSDSPLMEVFKNFGKSSVPVPQPKSN